MAEIPTVKKVYEAYHDQGFEVVAVSLDYEKQTLVDYIKEKELPWTQIYFESEDENQMNPLADKYSIDAIPATFLIDRAGNVVQTDVRGEALEPAVKELIE